MDAKSRRELLLEKLKITGTPITGTMLARELGVSRQVIVGDIAILRAAGENVYATPQGYVMPIACSSTGMVATIACHHGWDHLAEELAIIIDNGGKVLDVVVGHPVYGELRANLMLSSRRELAEFLQKLTESGAEPLSSVTGGVHLHTIEVATEDVLQVISRQLKERGILIS